MFLDPASPLTTFSISDNGEEDVSTESGAVTLTSNLSFRAVSRLQAQFSRDLQQSSPNRTDPLTEIPNLIAGFGRSSFFPPDPGTPPAYGGDLQCGRQEELMEIRRRRAAYLNLQFLSLAKRR